MFFHNFFNNIQSQPAALFAFFVVKNRSKIRGTISAEIPQGKRISKAIDKRVETHHHGGINKQRE